MRNVPQPSPMLLQPMIENLRHEIELLKIDGVPGNDGILLKRWFELFASGIDGRVNIFQFAAGGIFHDLRPRIIGFAESYGVGVARTAIAAEGFIGHFGDVRPSHHDRHAHGAHRVCHAIGLGDHSGHGADADQINFLFEHIAGNAGFIHGLGVAIDQNNFMAGGSKRL